MLIVENIPIYGLVDTLSDEDLFLIATSNKLARFERAANGDIIVKSIFGGITSMQVSELRFALAHWSKDNELGLAFTSVGVFCQMEPCVHPLLVG